MVPLEAFSTAAPHSSIAFCSGWVAGTQCEILRLTCLSCARAGPATAATTAPSNNARSFIQVLPLLWVPSVCDARAFIVSSLSPTKPRRLRHLQKAYQHAVGVARAGAEDDAAVQPRQVGGRRLAAHGRAEIDLSRIDRQAARQPVHRLGRRMAQTGTLDIDQRAGVRLEHIARVDLGAPVVAP